MDKKILRIIKVKDQIKFGELSSQIGATKANALKDAVNLAIKFDKELDILHSCITDLYNIDENIERIKKCLDDIEKTDRRE
jgi:hypothetical protein